MHDDDLRTALERAPRRDRAARRTDRDRRSARIEVAPTSNLSRPFESAVAQHDELPERHLEPRLADVFHAQAALHTEHWEIAAYEALLRLAPPAVTKLLEPNLDDERRAAAQMLEHLERKDDRDA